MIESTNTMRQWVSIGVLAVLGAAITGATWLGGEPDLALVLGIFYVLSCGASYLWSRGGGDVAAIIRLQGDERQQSLDMRATAAAGLVTLGFCVGGAVVNLAQGGTGSPWALILAVGGVSYTAALAVLRRRG